MQVKSIFHSLLGGWVKPSTAPAFVVLMLFLVGACVGAQSSDPDYDALHPSLGGSPLSVITTIPVLADLAQNVGGDEVEARSLVPPGADVHSYQTTPKDSIAIAGASLVVLNGAGLDDFLLPVLTGAMVDSAVLVVASKDMVEQGLGDGLDDPHFWQDPLLAIRYVERIRDGFIQADPNNAAAYRERAKKYVLRLRELDREISDILNQVPPENRRLVTYHRAFSSLGRRFSWETHALVAGDGVAVTPSAILQLSQIIQDNRLPAVFAEPQLSTSVLETTANEAHASVAPIYVDLATGGPVTYIDMMLFNARSLAENLR